MTDASPPAPEPLADAERPARVAYIDDCDDEFFLTDLLLRRAKVALSFERFEDGARFFEWAKAQERAAQPPADLVIADLNLPGMDGLEILRRLWETPALAGAARGVCSGSLDTRDRAAAFAAGAQFFVGKPFDASALASICEACPTLFMRAKGDQRVLVKTAG